MTVHQTAPLPFIVAVNFRCQPDTKTRIGFTAWYVCVFGVVLSVGDAFELPHEEPPLALGNPD